MTLFSMPRLMVAAPRKSSGKTMVSIGLGAALHQRGLQVQPFKKGPDFIDPMWLSAACGRRCRNLDFYMMGEGGIEAQFFRHGIGMDLNLVEGNMGLYDGLNSDGSDSGAALAQLLHLPVILVVNCHGIARSAAPLVWGHLNFPGHIIQLAGIVLNNISSPRQEKKIRESLEQCCPQAQVVGVLPRGDELSVHERHLGLIPPSEAHQVEEAVQTIGHWVGSFLDLDNILQLAAKACNLAPPTGNFSLSEEGKEDIILPFPKHMAEPASTVTIPKQDTPVQDTAQVVGRVGKPLPGARASLKVAIASDQAFHFYYPENMEALQERGIQFIPCNLLEDHHLPEVDGLFIGGGFPEVFLEKLSANKSMLDWVRQTALEGLPIYAECGGLMYLSQSIHWNQHQATMANVLPLAVEMQKRPVGYGYMEIASTGHLSWPHTQQKVRCHEFHYSSAILPDHELTYAYKVIRGHGITGKLDGIIHHNVLASYAHIHALGAPGWADFLVSFWHRGKELIA
ncbi:MAG: cobyrinate a,c-diamide synthase [Magnetococcales bacterium]|nr:cobyrinate a,c-diamide synthase [Magnetococcales bacterium]